MKVLVQPTPAEVAAAVADLVQRALTSSSSPRLGVATGATFEPVYVELLQRHQAAACLSHAALFLLDEYVGIAGDDPASYHHFIFTRLADKADISREQIHGPNGVAVDIEAESARYEQALRAAPIDLQLLGIGQNGHIGFNEPGSSLASVTRTVKLSDSTRQVNAQYFPTAERVPMYAVTQGVGTVMNAKRIVLAATGAQKADAVASALEGPVTTAVPASALQLHPDVTYILDIAAASKLTFSVEK